MIVVKDLCKEFQGKKIIDKLSFHISKGECIGLIGLNGAGKTTTINLLEGLLLPESGFVRVNGINPYRSRNENLKQIGCVNGLKTQLWTDMQLKYSFENSKSMYKIPKSVYEENLRMLKDTLEIDKLMNTKVSKLSLGQRIRSDFAYAILHNPKVLYLDEPTIGLDIIAKEKVLELIKRLNRERNTTIIYSSHSVCELENLCNRAIIIERGKKIFEGELQKLKENFSPPYKLELTIEKGQIPDIQDLPVNKYIVQDERILIYYNKKIINTGAILKHIMQQCKSRQVKIHEPTLEGTIKEIYKTKIIERGSL